MLVASGGLGKEVSPLLRAVSLPGSELVMPVLLSGQMHGTVFLDKAALDDGGWHILKWDHLRTFLASERPDLAALEPLLGLDPVVERSGEQMPLFDG